jgi:hypothetical protein
MVPRGDRHSFPIAKDAMFRIRHVPSGYGHQGLVMGFADVLIPG